MENRFTIALKEQDLKCSKTYKLLKTFVEDTLRELVSVQKTDRRRNDGRNGDLQSTITIRTMCIEVVEEVKLKLIKDISVSRQRALDALLKSNSHYYSTTDSRFINFKNNFIDGLLEILNNTTKEIS